MEISQNGQTLIYELNLFYGNTNIYHMLMTISINFQATVDGDEHDEDEGHDEDDTDD